MDVKILSKSKEKITFVLKDSGYVFANTLRKLILDEVPVMAIEDVEFRENSSVLYDEVIAHRLGLLPLSTNLKSYNMPDQCSCNGEGCAKCTIVLTLKAEGPCTVYASDMKSKDPDVVPVYPQMPIAVLLKNQEIILEATAMLGKGRDHVKYAPGWAFFKKYPSIEIKQSCNNCTKCVEACPVNVFDMKTGKLRISKDNLLNCHLCNACVEECPNNSIRFNDTEDYIFEVESFGQLDPAKIISEAVNQLNEKVEEFEKKLKAL